MGLSDADVKKQIQHMMAFIDQEANEKVEEIEAKAEEEFEIEKARLVTFSKDTLTAQYSRRYQLMEQQRKIMESNLLNQGRLKTLKTRNEHLADVIQKVREMLDELSKDTERYTNLMELLITQSLIRLLEPSVIVQCRENDADIVRKVSAKCVATYHNATGLDCKVRVDGGRWLAESCPGGVLVFNENESVKIDNTLDKRLETMSETLIPELREILFGANPLRKFKD